MERQMSVAPSTVYYGANDDVRPDVTGEANSLKSEKLGKMPKSNHFILPAFLLEVAILACLAVFAYYLRFTEVFAVYNRYFSMGDTRLSYPAENNTANVTANAIIYVNDIDLYTICALLPILFILLGECLYAFSGPTSSKVISTITDKLKVPLIIRRMFRFIGTFWMGMLLTSILVDSIKLLTGSKRPYFYDVFINSTDSIDANYIEDWTSRENRTNGLLYVHEDAITGTVREAMMSFPSYYAAMSAYAATFTICYVGVVADIHGNYFLQPILSISLAGMSILAGWTRWMLYKNHWEDLVIGYHLGIAMAFYIVYGTVNGFLEHPPPEVPLQTRLEHLQEARAGFFKWNWLPRLTARNSPPRSAYPPSTTYTNGNPENTPPFEPNPAFQQDLNRGVEDHVRRVGPSY